MCRPAQHVKQTTMTPATTASADTPTTDWLGLIQSEFRESPGLRLSLPQACRFWGLDERISAALFAALVDAGFLRQTRAGAFVRVDVA